MQVNGPLGIRYNCRPSASWTARPCTHEVRLLRPRPHSQHQLDDFHAALLSGRRRRQPPRINHAIERLPLVNLNAVDYSGNGLADSAFLDVTRDGVVDDFDIFINHFDTNGDGRIVLSDALRAGTPNEALGAEFTLDDAMAS